MTIVVAWLFLILSSLLTWKNPQWFIIIFLLDIWLFSHPHAIATFFKKTTYTRISLPLLLGTLTVITTVLCLGAYHYGTVVLFNLYFYWQWLHYARQNYGIAIQGSTRPLTDRLFLHVMPIVALLALFAKGPLGLLGYYIWFFDLPLFPNMMHALYGCLFFIWLFVRLSNQTMDTLKTSSFWHCFSTFILYYVVYIATETFVVAWIGMTFFHNAQYLFYNWRKRDFIIFQQKSSNPLFFYFILLIISASIYGAAGGLAVLFSTPFLPTGLISVFAINILHYVCDSFIWRRQHL